MSSLASNKRLEVRVRMGGGDGGTYSRAVLILNSG